MKQHADKIACLLIEPIMGNCLGIAAEHEYVRAARQLCDKYGILFIMDDVKSGFRVARGGVQELYGVKADLCTFAKAVANGYPISLLAGTGGDHAQAGPGRRFHGVAPTPPTRSQLAAADKTRWRCWRQDSMRWTVSPTYGQALRDGMSAILGARGIAHSFVGHPSMSGLYFAAEPPRTYRHWKSSDYSFYDAMAQVLHEERVLCEPDSREPWFICAAHDDACLADTLRGFEIAVDATLRDGAGTARKATA